MNALAVNFCFFELHHRTRVHRVSTQTWSAVMPGFRLLFTQQDLAASTVPAPSLCAETATPHTQQRHRASLWCRGGEMFARTRALAAS